MFSQLTRKGKINGMQFIRVNADMCNKTYLPFRQTNNYYACSFLRFLMQQNQLGQFILLVSIWMVKMMTLII